MRKSSIQSFPVLLKKFFTQRLQQQRHVSLRTVTVYFDSFRLLVAFAYQRLHKQPCNLAIEDLNAQFILEFLRHLEQDRHNCIRSRNARFGQLISHQALDVFGLELLDLLRHGHDVHPYRGKDPLHFVDLNRVADMNRIFNSDPS
ncbi:hypothetical protein [Paraburkholderia youngii]|uniref:hypothetical protein n=1 Tax=Paraburkholderia youngii TaxID=2782701 RepID=UPI001595C83E|nr:hypothetical protein [Paraburkholderia youngii]